MSHHILQTMQLSSNIPNDNEHDLLQPNHCTSCDSIHGQHLGIYQNYRRIYLSGITGPSNPEEQQPLPVAIKMPFLLEGTHVLRIHNLAQISGNRPYQGK